MAENTRNQVLELLRRGVIPSTNWRQALELTDNAVASHLAALERQGFVQQSAKCPAFADHMRPTLDVSGEALFPRRTGRSSSGCSTSWATDFRG